MSVYIALLRGINVGGKNIIKMAELKRVFEELGLCEVKTYIQSGNVIFKSEEEEKPLRERIERGLEGAFGFTVPVILRRADELQEVIRNCPFSEEEVSEAELSSGVESLYVAFLSDIPLQEKVDRLRACKGENDEYKILGREVFLLFRSSIRNSKLASNLHRLEVQSTVRNWKNISKLVELSGATPL